MDPQPTDHQAVLRSLLLGESQPIVLTTFGLVFGSLNCSGHIDLPESGVLAHSIGKRTGPRS